MTSRIKKLDRGFIAQVKSVWHSVCENTADRFSCLGEGNNVSIEQAHEVLDFGIKKVPVFRGIPGFYKPIPGNYCLVRTDHDVVIVPHVGERFTAESHSMMLDYIDRFVLAEFPDAVIDSTLTLNNGSIGIVSIKVGEFNIKGDDSQTISNLTAINPLGEGSFLVCGNNTRVVCWNTSQFALSEGRKLGAYAKIRHTKWANMKVANAMINIAEAKLGMVRMTETLEKLSKVEVNTEYIDNFLEAMFPTPPVEERTPRKFDILSAKRNGIMNIFESDQHMAKSINRSKYALFQSYTDYVDHGGDGDYGANEVFDGMTGARATKKNQALTYLCNMRL